MKILRTLYDKLDDEIKDMQKKFEELQSERNDRRSEGDLSENEEYSKLSEQVLQLSNEIIAKLKLKEEAEVVEIVNIFDTIHIGCKFKCTIKNSGDRINGKKSIAWGVTKATYDDENDTTTSIRTLTIGGPLDSDLVEGIISSESKLGEFLIGRGVGEYRMVNTNNTYQIVKIEMIE